MLRLEAGFEDLQNFSRTIFPGRDVHYLLMGTPLAKIDFDGHNNWVSEEAAKDPASVAAMIVTPQMTAESVSSMIEKKNFKVL